MCLLWLLQCIFIDDGFLANPDSKLREGRGNRAQDEPNATWLHRRNTMIKKVKGGYKVISEKKGKNLGGPYKTREEAEKRLRQVEYFKHNKG